MRAKDLEDVVGGNAETFGFFAARLDRSAISDPGDDLSLSRDGPQDVFGPPLLVFSPLLMLPSVAER